MADTRKVKIMRGCSGSGKSTYVQKHYPKAMVCSTDNFWIDENGKCDFNPKLIGEAHAWNLRRFIYEVMNGEGDIVVDNTNTTVAELAPYYAVAAAYGLDVEIITLDVDENTARPRNVHKVPQDVVHGQRRNLVKNNDFIPKFWKHKIVKEN